MEVFMMASNTKKSITWGWIVFWLILFWPVGIFLLFKKQSTDKSATLKNTKTLIIVSYILIFMGILYPLMAFTGNLEVTDDSMDPVSAGIFMVVLFGGGGVLLNIKARKMKITGDRYRKYIALVVNQNQTSISNIASAVGVSYEVAENDLQKMIDDDYFHGAYINVAQREIILAQAAPQRDLQTVNATRVQEKITTCGGCGANNRVTIGRIVECEYCGTLLQ
jgi:hypothetical protein